MTRRRVHTAPRRFWTVEEDAIVRRFYPHQATSELTRLLPGRTVPAIYNRAFGRLNLRKTPEFLASPVCHRLDGKIGAATRFKKGHVPWTKGTHWSAGGRSLETRFKKGNVPHTHVPVGTKVKATDGYWKVKVGEPRQWRWVHRMVWEEANGPIPPGGIVKFRDGNADNTALSNLTLITRQELMARNTIHNYPQPIPRLVQLRGALIGKINRGRRALEEQA